jgi:hypothetical protein
MLVDDPAVQPEPNPTAQVATGRFANAKKPDELDEEEQTEQRLANAWRARQGHGGRTLALVVEFPDLIKDNRVALSHKDALLRNLLPQWRFVFELHDGSPLASISGQEVLVVGVGEVEDPAPKI